MIALDEEECFALCEQVAKSVRRKWGVYSWEDDELFSLAWLNLYCLKPPVRVVTASVVWLLSVKTLKSVQKESPAKYRCGADESPFEKRLIGLLAARNPPEYDHRDLEEIVEATALRLEPRYERVLRTVIECERDLMKAHKVLGITRRMLERDWQDHVRPILENVFRYTRAR